MNDTAPGLRDYLQIDGQRLDRSIHGRWASRFSRTQVQNLIKEGRVKINGDVINKPSSIYTGRSLVEINPFPKSTFHLPTDMKAVEIPILYDDSHLAILHKPHGMTVHPGNNTGQDTLVHFLLSKFKNLSNMHSGNVTESNQDNFRPGIVHRLDRDTEGLIVIAKTDATHVKLAKQFAERTIDKEYHAWLYGCLSKSEETINGYIQRHPISRKKMLFSFTKKLQSAKEAVLSYKILKQLAKYTLVRIKLYTGRTHQIRSTFLTMGTPIVGDNIYGYNKMLEADHKLQLLLMANAIRFIHPILKKELSFKLPLPERFTSFHR